jgi:RNA polymerase sigma-70 factor (ECF subfamily)
MGCIFLMASDELSDLIGRIGLGDRQAFRRLYDATSPKLFAVCLRVLRERGEAEDALQEVYVKVWQNAPRFTVPGYSPISWLSAIARNHAIDRIRARKPQTVDIEDIVEIADNAPDPEGLLLAKSDMTRIDRCLSELKADRAEAVRSAYIEGYSYQELADRYGLPINTLRTWLRRSLLSLKECLQR